MKTFSLGRCFPILIVAYIVAYTASVSASTAEAWQDFRENVEQSCLENVATALTDVPADYLFDVSIWVDQFGTDSFGLAVITTKSKWGEDERKRTLVCIYDKQTKEVEITEVVVPDS